MRQKYDNWFYYRLISTIIIIGGLIGIYALYILNGEWVRIVNYPFSPVLFNSQFFSYFTFQSNILVAVWFLLATIFYSRKFCFIKNIFLKIAVTSYIGVTGVIYITVILPGLFFQNQIVYNEIVSGLFLHLVVPVLMLIDTMKNRSHLNISWKQYFKRNFWWYLSYPLGYALLILGRILLYLNDPSLKNLPFMIIFPYLPIFNSAKNFAELAPEYPKIIGLTFGFALYIYALFIIVNIALIAWFKFNKETKNNRKIKK